MGVLLLAAVLILSGAAERDAGSTPPGMVPVGTILAFGGPATAIREEEGWLPCDGRELPVAGYRELYAAVGGAWGEDSRAGTFRVPDLRGRFVRGVADAAPGIWRDPEAGQRMPSAPGGNEGDRVGTLQGDTVGSHGHDVVGVGNASGPGADGGWIRFYLAKVPDAEAPVLRNSAVVMPSDGAESRPVNAAVQWMIRIR